MVSLSLWLAEVADFWDETAVNFAVGDLAGAGVEVDFYGRRGRGCGI